MFIIAFSNKSNKFLAKLFCKNFKHVAPIYVHKNKMILYQFVKHNNIKKIELKLRDLFILQKHGWQFLVFAGQLNTAVNTKLCFTCVQLTKTMIKLKSPWIQTPEALYKKLSLK